MTGPQDRPRFTFGRSRRLSRRREFRAVYDSGVRAPAGPLVVWARPNGLVSCRLGLAVSRRVGKAVLRSRIKRLLRESFRLVQHEIPPGYDLVIVARDHELLELAEYQDLLRRAAAVLHGKWRRRAGADRP